MSREFRTYFWIRTICLYLHLYHQFENEENLEENCTFRPEMCSCDLNRSDFSQGYTGMQQKAIASLEATTIGQTKAHLELIATRCVGDVLQRANAWFSNAMATLTIVAALRNFKKVTFKSSFLYIFATKRFMHIGLLLLIKPWSYRHRQARRLRFGKYR